MTTAIEFQISLGFQNAHGICRAFSHIVAVIVMVMVCIGCAALLHHKIFTFQNSDIDFGHQVILGAGKKLEF